MTEQDKGPSPPSPASSASPLSKHTTMTTPDRQPSPAQPGHTHPSNITRDNNLDDIWGDSPPQSPHPDPDPTSTSASASASHAASHAASHDLNPNPTTTTTTAPTTTTTTTTSRTINNEPLLSDLPSLRRQHMTAGYREGLGVGKARVMQGGFDMGYLVGVLIGLRVGRVLGVLEGVVVAAATARAKGNRRGVGNAREGEERERDEDGDGEEDGKMVWERRREEVQRLLEQARRELDRGLLLEGLDEDVVMRAEGVPERVEGVLRWWEGRVLGSFEGKSVRDD